MRLGSYLESAYKFWYLSSYLISYLVGIITFIARYQTIQFSKFSHIFTATYSIYLLILVEKKMKLINPLQIWTNIKNHQIWAYLRKIGKAKTKQSINEIDLSHTQRSLSIKGGQTDDSFSYDSFFTYNESLQMELEKQRNRQRQKYFQSNISERTSSLTSFPLTQMKHKSINTQSFSSQKSIRNLSQIQELNIQQNDLKSQKKQQQIQLLKIYKCIILSFFIFTSVSRAQWIAYIVSGCVIMGFVQILTNQKLKVLKFGCFAFLACSIFCIF